MNEYEPAVPAVRNVWSYVAIWLVITSWTLLGVRIMAGDMGAITGPVDWLYVMVLGAALVVAAIGLVAIRKRGEPVLAIAVFAFSLMLPALYALFFLLVAPLFHRCRFRLSFPGSQRRARS